MITFFFVDSAELKPWDFAIQAHAHALEKDFDQLAFQK